MNWEAVSAVSEAVGVVGVIASLVYLGMQTRQSTQATRAATVDQITGRFNDWINTYANSPTYRQYFFSGLDGLRVASDDHKMGFFTALQSLYRLMEEIQYQRAKGLVDDEIWTGWDNWFANMKSYEVVAYFFEGKNTNMSPLFREYWNNLSPKSESNLVSIINSLNQPKA